MLPLSSQAGSGCADGYVTDDMGAVGEGTNLLEPRPHYFFSSGEKNPDGCDECGKKGDDQRDRALTLAPSEKHGRKYTETGTKARTTTRQQAGHQERGLYHPCSDVLVLSRSDLGG